MIEVAMDLNEVTVLIRNFERELAFMLQRSIVKLLDDNRNDFIRIFTRQLMKGSEETEESVKLNVESLFETYRNSIVVDNNEVKVIDALHEATGMDIMSVAATYEFGTAEVPPRPIWRTVIDVIRFKSERFIRALDEKVAQKLAPGGQ
jgi:hypothetical protein